MVKICVKSKKSEPGAYAVTINYENGRKKTTKWFRGEKTFPAKRANYQGFYGRICMLIDRCYERKEPVCWQPWAIDLGAVAHQKRCEKNGSCEPLDSL
jgi:hypothetical protein